MVHKDEQQSINATYRALHDINALLFKMFKPGTSEVSERRGYLFDRLTAAQYLFENNEPLPPLLKLEIFILTQEERLPHPAFILDWLLKGSVEFHESEGLEHFERGLGFTASRGKYSGQGHEFKTAKRKNSYQVFRLLLWIRLLSEFGGYTVDRAVGIVHELHVRILNSRLRKRKPLAESVLHEKYRSWKGKNWDDRTTDYYRQLWEKHRNDWQNQIESVYEEDSE